MPPEKEAKPITVTQKTNRPESSFDRQTISPIAMTPPTATPHNTLQRPPSVNQAFAQVTALQQNTFVVTTQAPIVNNRNNSIKQLTVKALPTDNNTFIVAAE
jgi:hypothetical protein